MPDHLFLVTQGFSCPSERLSKLVLRELHAFLGASYLASTTWRGSSSSSAS
jgi:hypothetical protein